MPYYCDTYRHLVCIPYSQADLHEMARDLDIKRCWFRRGSRMKFAHYDIPKLRYDEIAAKCNVVTNRDILNIVKYGYLCNTASKQSGVNEQG